MRTVITGVGLAVPGVDRPADLLGRTGPAAEPVDVGARLGRGGLRYKDRATLLGRCAGLDALTGAGLLDGGELRVPADRCGVVVSSNFGNLDTVCRTVDTIAAEAASAVSPMDLPNASSNIIASTIAIEHGLRGPNLTVCNGITSGLDAVHWAASLVAAGRAEAMLVVGVEADTGPVRRLLGTDRAFDGAVALVVEPTAAARVRGARIRAGLGGYARRADAAACLTALAGAGGRWEPAPAGAALLALPGAADRPPTGALTRWRGSSGALGVLACAASVGWTDLGGPGPLCAVVADDGADAAAALTVRAPAVSW